MACGICDALPQFQQDNDEPQYPEDSFEQQEWGSSNEFLDQNQQFSSQPQPGQLQQMQPQQPANQPITATATTAAFFQCFNNCPTTNEYNPVCGSNNVNYHNVHKIRCTNECGRRVDPNWIGEY